MEAASWQKKQFSRAYLHALAAREGLPVGSWNVDKDGVDATSRRGALNALLPRSGRAYGRRWFQQYSPTFRTRPCVVLSSVGMREQRGAGGHARRRSIRRPGGGDPLNRVLLAAAETLNEWRSMCIRRAGPGARFPGSCHRGRPACSSPSMASGWPRDSWLIERCANTFEHAWALPR